MTTGGEPAGFDEPTDVDWPTTAYRLCVNGVAASIDGAWIGESLLHVLRERLGLAGTKHGCGQGECGACTVLLDGRVAAACLVPAVAAQGHDIRTIEGLSAGQDKLAESLTRALSEVLVAGCGGCAPGIVVSAHALLRRNEDPSANAVREALSGHLCRCLSTGRVVEAVRAAAAAYRADASQHDTANEN